MSTKKPQDLEQGEGTSLLSSPPPYTALPGSSSSHANIPTAAASPAHPTPPLPPSRPLHPYPQGPSPFASLPLPQTSLYAHERQVQMRQADRRARRRFCAAMCWAGLIYIALAILSGAVVGAAIGAGAGDGHDHEHRHRKDRDWRGDWFSLRTTTRVASDHDAQSQPYAII
ncbi:hypothetical protein JCM3766R1_001076 [Sporobolomyces carnicolor]